MGGGSAACAVAALLCRCGAVPKSMVLSLLLLAASADVEGKSVAQGITTLRSGAVAAAAAGTNIRCGAALRTITAVSASSLLG